MNYPLTRPAGHSMLNDLDVQQQHIAVIQSVIEFQATSLSLRGTLTSFVVWAIKQSPIRYQENFTIFAKKTNIMICAEKLLHSLYGQRTVHYPLEF